MHANLQTVDWSKLSGELYSYWFVAVSVLGFLGFLFRSPILKHLRRLANVVLSANEQVIKIDALNEKLSDAQSRADDWRIRYSEMEARYDALQTELNRLHDDLQEFRKRMMTSETLVRLLTNDRDALIKFSRLLTTQIYAGGHVPKYPPPGLESIVDVPAPTLPDVK